jgi:4-amino-4-deoxy-L-arabinose transferase-like glycosyltransferase
MTIDPGRARRLVVGAAVAGLLVRLAFGLLYWTGKPLTHDEREYLALAQAVAEGRGFTYDDSIERGTAQQFGRAPAYPFFLAVIGAGRAAGEASPVRVKVAQAVVGAIGVWLIGLIARRAAGDLAGVAAAAIAAIYPPLVWIAAYVLSETLYSTLALAVALLLDVGVERADRAESSRAGSALALAAGMLSGVAILARPVMLFFLPLAAIWLVRRRHTSLAVVMLVTALAVVAPWTARNYRVYDRFVLVASEGGVTFWTGNHPLARGEGDLAANPAIKAADLEFRAAHPGLSAEELEPLYYRDALRHIAAHPGWWLGLVARKAFYTVVPAGPSYTLHSMRYLGATLVSYLAVLVAAVPGLRIIRKSRTRPTALLLLAASTVLVSLVFFPQERFRIPVIDPTLIVLAAATCARRLETR